MAVKNVALPLFDEPFYTYAVALQGQSYTAELVYNERAQLYFLSLYTADKEPILLGVGLVPNYPITFDYILPGLSGFFWLELKARTLGEPYKEYPDQLSQFYDFYYVYND